MTTGGSSLYPLENDQAPSHSVDYRSVTVRGMDFAFSPSQAAIIKVLWEAAGEVGQETLLEAAGCESKRVRDLFRLANGTMHPAWGHILMPGGSRGSFRLDL
jgi:hypothetical protein